MAYTELLEGTKIRASVLNENFNAVRQETTAKVAQAKAEILSDVSDYQDDIDEAVSNMQTTVNNCVTKSGTQTITGYKTFSGKIIVPATAAESTAIRLDKRTSHGLKLGDGTIINWGRKYTAQRNTNYTINFEIAFTADTYTLVLTPEYNEEGTVTPFVKTKNLDSAIIRGDEKRTMAWFAIGR
ncbi:hypothetical protein IKP85_06690 [bacterium]|nr:hypothetical protein [bacterium]